VLSPLNEWGSDEEETKEIFYPNEINLNLYILLVHKTRK
jgi:hypothetical protein